MDIIGIIVICAIVGFAVLGAIIGAVKGFTKVASWGVEYVLACTVAILLSTLVGNTMEKGESGFSAIAPAVVSLALVAASVILFAALFALLRRIFARGIEKRKKRSYYQQYEDMEDNKEQILDAIDAKDNAQYKRLAKKKFKQKGGGWAVADKIVGGFVLAVKAAAIVGIISAIIFAFADLSHLSDEGAPLNEIFGGSLASDFWYTIQSRFLFDAFVTGLIMLCIKSGFSSGISSWIWIILCLGMTACFGYASYYMCFKTGIFDSAAAGLAGKLASPLESVASILEKAGITNEQVARGILTLGIFLLFLVVVILFGVFVPKLIDKARDGRIFTAVDGVLGAIALTAVVLGILLVVGAVLNSVMNYSFMTSFNVYFEDSSIATYFYDENVIVNMGQGEIFSIAKYLGDAVQ